MKKYYLLLPALCVGLLIYSLCNAQTTDNTENKVPIVAYWSKGDTFDYEITKTRIDSSRTKGLTTNEQRFLARVTVVDSTDSSYRLEYYRLAELPPPLLSDSIPEDIRQKIRELAQIKVVYETNGTGLLREILNQEDIQEKIDEDYHSMLELIDAESHNPGITALIETFMLSFSSEALINLYAQDILALHYGLGYEWDTQDTIDFEEELMAPLFNIPITAKGTFYCNRYEKENDLISLREEKKIVGDYKQDIVDFLHQYKSHDNPISEEQLQNLDIGIEIQNTYEYNSMWGIPLLAILHKGIDVTTGEEVLHRKEIHRIELQPNLP